MKINRALLTNGVSQKFIEEIDFSSVSFDPTHIKNIPSCVVKATATDYESILRIEVEINALVIGVCAYSLEDVELKLKINDACGNCLLHDLPMCLWESRRYLNRLKTDFHCEYTKLQVTLQDGKVFADA